MNKKIISTFLKENCTIKQAMDCINKSGFRFSLVVNKNKKLLGIVTDGNIRNGLLAGKNLGTPVREIMTRRPITAPKGMPASKLLEMMLKKGIQEIPIVDNKNIVIDIALFKELKNIPLSSPDITYKEVEIINQVLGTPFLSIGPKIEEFEKKMANFIGTKYAIAVNSGTSGLHLCIKSLDIKDGDEVITTPFSFISSANCILFERAKPVFVDINRDTLCIDASKIEEKITRRTKAILPVHIFGHSCEMDKIKKIAKKHNLAIIEDACEALGTEYKGRKVGTFGEAAVFSFYPNKQITTSEGGLIVTNNKKIADLCQSMRSQGRGEGASWLNHVRLGYNYRMSELNAALGAVQIERIGEILEKREKVANLYNEKLKEIEEIKIPYVASDVKMSWFVYVIRLDERKFSERDRDRIIHLLEIKGINCRNYFPSIHLQPFYIEKFNYKKRDFPITEKVSDLTIALPFYNNLSMDEINYVCEGLKDIVSNFKKHRLSF